MTRIFNRLSTTGLRDPQRLKFELDKNFTQVESLLEQMVRAVSSMDDLAPVTITAAYTGAVDPASQLPLNIQATRLYNGTDVSSTATWDLDSDTGAVTASVDASGLVTITAAVGSDNLTVSSTHLNVELTKLIPITFSIAAPPQTGTGGGTSAYDTSFSSFNSATHAPVSDELTVTVGVSGQVDLTAPLFVRTAASAPTGTFKVYGKWQWWDGIAWADVAAEVASSTDCSFDGTRVHKGSLTVNTSKTGLTPTNSEKFRLEARNDSGTRTMTLSGTASAVA